MVSTKHCCWGKCNSDSRYEEKLHKSLKEVKASGQKIFIPFPKPSQGIEKCQRWINACARKHFDIAKITRNTYICALHWPGEKGPTAEFHDPLKATFKPKEVKITSAPKRKASKDRIEPTNKKKKSICEEVEEEGNSTSLELVEDEISLYESPSAGKTASDKESQTQYCKYMLSAIVESVVLRKEVSKMTNEVQAVKGVSNLSYENMCNDSKVMKHFVGLTAPQFEALNNFLDSICPLNGITGSKQSSGTCMSKTNSIFNTRQTFHLPYKTTERIYYKDFTCSYSFDFS
jgi:hypothetical protein